VQVRATERRPVADKGRRPAPPGRFANFRTNRVRTSEVVRKLLATTNSRTNLELPPEFVRKLVAPPPPPK
jgi:hypothetical protein